MLIYSVKKLNKFARHDMLKKIINDIKREQKQKKYVIKKKIGLFSKQQYVTNTQQT